MPRLPLALLFMAFSASAQPALPTAEQSFDLFARFMLEGDADAAAQVSELTGAPLRSERWEDAVDRVVLGDAPTDDARTRLGRELSRQIALALRQTHCRSTGSERRDNDGLQIAIVDYTCQMPDLAAQGDAAPAGADSEHDALSDVRAAITRLQHAPSRAQTHQVILARNGDSDLWIPQDLPPLHVWVERLLLPEY
ncbi:hypothetical protein [Stenotrophomonas sp.]|uniref:hypothetical protein n=1 Tax=Stenotrophomonas sp. TaxID=69392 RepID=UPI0031CFE28E